jgi:hypothetical protein
MSLRFPKSKVSQLESETRNSEKRQLWEDNIMIYLQEPSAHGALSTNDTLKNAIQVDMIIEEERKKRNFRPCSRLGKAGGVLGEQQSHSQILGKQFGPEKEHRTGQHVTRAEPTSM